MIKTHGQEAVDAYFTAQEKTKGLLLFGPNGTGKTTAMRPYATNKMWNASAIEYANKIAESGPAYIQRWNMHDMYIDDLGRERDNVSHYGDRNITPLHDLLHFRYEIFKTQGYRTHISTNLTMKEIEAKYGLQIADRIKEMCEVIHFKGDSLRK